jgi:glycosyltransferase involved in cell wall biosynthesis
LVSRALRACASRVDSGIAISNAVANDVRKALPRLPISVIHDAIDTDVFSPAGEGADLDALAGMAPAPAGTVRVGLVATYARWKGHEVFLQAAQRVKAALPARDVRFYVVGGAIYDTAASQYRQDELECMARELRLEQDVCFIPFQSRIDEVYRALDVVVHASTRPEPFGRTIAEAMATGKAVIASRDSGAAELYADGADAVDVPSRSPGDLATAIGALVTDASRRSNLGSAARAAAVKCFSRERLARQVLAVYRNAGCST